MGRIIIFCLCGRHLTLVNISAATFVAFQLALPMPENLLSLVKEWGKRYGVFDISGFSGDG
jgi:hypothetical protein